MWHVLCVAHTGVSRAGELGVGFVPMQLNEKEGDGRGEIVCGPSMQARDYPIVVHIGPHIGLTREAPLQGPY